jgi:hypothetical protein
MTTTTFGVWAGIGAASIIGAVLWILAGVSAALLAYEGFTLVTAVLWPLWHDPHILQTDFHYYYDAAVRVREGGRLYLPTDDVIAGFAYPPPAMVPFVALSHLPLGRALAVFTALSYAAVLASVALWLRYLRQRGLAVDARTAVAAGLVAVALGPTYSNAVFGQVNALVLFCAVGFITLGPARPALGGTLLAAGVWLKIYPVVLVAVGLWNRSAWPRLAYAAMAGVAIAAAAMPIVPPSAYAAYWTDVLPARFDATALHITNQSLIAFVERLAVPPERFLHWTGEQAVQSGAAVRGFNLLCGVAVMALLWRRAVRGPRLAAVHAAAGLMALAALISPLGWGHTYVLALPLVLLHLAVVRHASPAAVVVVAGCVLALMVPAGRHLPIDALPGWLQNVVYSRYLWATVVLLALPAAAPDYTTGAEGAGDEHSIP